MKIGEEPKEFFLCSYGTSEEFFIGVDGKTTDDVLAAWRHSTLEEVDYAKKQIAQTYIARGDAVPVLMTVRVQITVKRL